MNELIGRADNYGAMASAQETAEIANIQAKMILARQFPRSPEICLRSIMLECQNKELAEKATYEFKRDKTVVKGPSIRLVECVARHWGNISSGIKEIASNDKTATVKAFCWDLETNFYDEKIFDIEYKRYTKNGTYELIDERDRYEKLANMAARRKRACMQAVIPQYIIDEAVEACQVTLENAIKEENAQKSIEDIRKSMLDAFKGIATWVCEEDFEAACGKPFNTLGTKDIVKLRNLYNAIKDGFVKPDAAFGKEKIEPSKTEEDNKALDDVNSIINEVNVNGQP